ncbi:MAG TPA: hypothetical protein PKJ63_10790 [Cyclobacteriaceae bacterium]|nr:hypothetical protein [Cyclobacteriaceae bacterium]
MTIIIKKGESKRSIQRKLGRLKTTRKKFPSEMFNGIIEFKKDGVEIQKELRDEWERSID